MLDLLSSSPASPPAIPPTITAAAGFVASATARFDTAMAALQAAEKSAAAVRGRVVALDAERATIIQRRAGGQHEDGDGARLALIAADLEGLAPLQAEADAAVSEARRKVEGEEHLVANARQQLDRAEAEAQLTALVQHARALDTMMVSTLAKIAQTSARIGAPGKPPFAPSPALVLEMRRHAAAHGLL